MSGKRFFIIAGEASGDAHAAALIAQLKQLKPNATFAGLGGEKMEEEGCALYLHYRHMAFMGFAAVLANLPQIRRNFAIAKQALLKDQPDALILIDYPSFNLKMAKFCRKHLPQTKIYYYVPPKVWAWKKRRIHTIAKLCDEVLGIFPFEPDFYAKYGYRCTYVGHPTVEQMMKVKDERSKVSGERTIAILPGSRRSEISHCLPRMLDAARRYDCYQIVVTAAPGVEDEFYAPYLHHGERLTRDTYGAVLDARAAIVNSGTATLETALLGCPQVAVYHLALSGLIHIVRSWGQPILFSISYFTPVNIIAGQPIIPECIADEFTVDKVTAELQRLLTDERAKKEMLASYEHLYSILGSQSASETAASIICTQ